MSLEKLLKKINNDKGESLHDLGINEIAFSRKDALELLSSIKNEKLAILGGDVYVKMNGIIKPTYDNWYLNRDNQTWNVYVDESINKAQDYISHYDPKNVNVYFTIVVKHCND